MSARLANPDGEAVARGDALRRAKDFAGAAEAYRAAVAAIEVPAADDCLRIARCHHALADAAETFRWLMAAVDAPTSYTGWQAASALLAKVDAGPLPAPARRIRLAILGSYTTVQLAPMLRLALRRRGVDAEVLEADYGQYRQEILDPASAMHAFDPDVVVMAVHAGETALPPMSDRPEEDVELEVGRWTGLWRALGERSRARLVMHAFAIPPEDPMGNLAARTRGARSSMLRAVNERLGIAAGSSVGLVDCDRIASRFGTARWFDDRYWHLSKQAVSLDALPLLARHTAAVVAADLGLAKKCLVLDLDNTLWGGVIGEDGLAGIALGQGSPAGEAYQAFQRYVVELEQRGVILAVCSKNNEADALEPFESHPDMLVRREHVAAFVANWEPKPENLRAIAKMLNIGLDSLVFVDDNPAEREIVRQIVPEVEVVTLPSDPAGFVRALDETLLFEAASYTAEDAKRTEQYRARAEIAKLEGAAASLEDFFTSLGMQAEIEPFSEMTLPRVVQLIGKTNQFNLTTRRHSMEAVRGFTADEDCVHFSLKLRDRFTDHGLVSVMIAFRRGDALSIDTWLMSCRVISRTVEDEMLAWLCRRASELGCTRLEGTYVPTAKNAMVKDVFERFGFELVSDEGGTTTWTYDIAARGPITNRFISHGETAVDAA